MEENTVTKSLTDVFLDSTEEVYMCNTHSLPFYLVFALFTIQRMAILINTGIQLTQSTN